MRVSYNLTLTHFDSDFEILETVMYIKCINLTWTLKYYFAIFVQLNKSELTAVTVSPGSL